MHKSSTNLQSTMIIFSWGKIRTTSEKGAKLKEDRKKTYIILFCKEKLKRFFFFLLFSALFPLPFARHFIWSAASAAHSPMAHMSSCRQSTHHLFWLSLGPPAILAEYKCSLAMDSTSALTTCLYHCSLASLIFVWIRGNFEGLLDVRSLLSFQFSKGKESLR